MRFTKLYLLCSLLALIALTGCGKGAKDAPQKPRVPSKGLPSELLLVVDKAVWESAARDTLEQLTSGSVPGMLQAEPFFRTTHIFAPYYDHKFSTFHSQLFVQLDTTLTKPFLGIRRNAIATPQIEVTVGAPTIASLTACLSQQQDRIRNIIADAQIEMRIAQLKQKHSHQVDAALHQLMGLHIYAPEEIRFTKTGENFLWASSGQNQRDLNIAVYSYPWDGTAIFNASHFAHVRDSVMQQNIPGGKPGQWMETTREKGQPIVLSQVRKIGQIEMQEVRGLWQMHDAAMGGPFVSLVRIDTTAKKVIVCEGFVYSPATEKRDLLRRVEAAIRTI